MKKTVSLAFGLLLFLATELLLYFFCDQSAAEMAATFRATHEAALGFFRIYTDAGLGLWYAWPSGIGTILTFFLRKRNVGWAQKAFPPLLFFFAATSGAGLASNVLKYFIGRARPALLLKENVFGFQPFTHGYLWNSMPSGHTTTVFSVAAALSLLWPKGKIFFFLFALSVGFSRILVGAHYPSDVVFGAVLGVTFVYALQILLHRLQKSRNP